MKTKFFMLMAMFLSVSFLKAQNRNYINLIVPGSDSLGTQGRFQRLNGNTAPGSALFLNGKEIKVWPTGAFAEFVELVPGKNRVIIESVHPRAGVSTRKVVIVSNPPEHPQATSGFRIEHAGIIPPRNQELLTGDIIQVQMKAQSGCKASFNGNKPMKELPESQTGVRGIYQGTYRIGIQDTFRNTKIDFNLTGQDGETVISWSDNTISANTGFFPATGSTKGTFPSLYYGLGEDRLGGARMGYLDTLVLLPLSGKIGNMYRVRLGESRNAYIPEHFVTILPEGTFPPFSLAESWSVTGDDKYDYVRIGLSQRLPYISKYEINPLKIVVDIFGAISNTNWITQLNSTREIKNVYYEQTEKEVMRITIELIHDHPWGYSIYYDENRLVIRIKQQPRTLKLKHLKIGLDAGHGGEANGALGSTGAKEKDINLAVVLKLRSALERTGARIILTRQADDDVAMAKRWQIWQQDEPDIALSIHCNSIGNSDPNKVQGTSTYYKYIAFRPLSKIMYDELLKTGLKEFGNIGSFNFTLNAPTEFPNTLLELAFMSNPEDEMQLLDPTFQDRIVTAVLSGLERYLRLCKK